MRDKQFLDKIEVAYKIYKEQGHASKDIEAFINWLYTQYGLINNKKD